MAMIRAADAIMRFLASHGMDAKGVRVVVEIDNLDKAYRVREALQREFDAMTWKISLDAPNPLKNLEIGGVPFSFVAKIEV